MTFFSVLSFIFRSVSSAPFWKPLASPIWMPSSRPIFSPSSLPSALASSHIRFSLCLSIFSLHAWSSAGDTRILVLGKQIVQFISCWSMSCLFSWWMNEKSNEKHLLLLCFCSHPLSIGWTWWWNLFRLFQSRSEIGYMVFCDLIFITV